MSRKRKKKFDDMTTAEKHVSFRKEFRTYLIMVAFFIMINKTTNPYSNWWIWPTIGWGLGIAIKASSLYGPFKDPVDEEEFDLYQQRPERREKELETRRRDNGSGYREDDLV